MEDSEIAALIKLIDDEDSDIYQNVAARLLAIGGRAYQQIYEHSLRADSELQHERLTKVLSQLHVGHLKHELTEGNEHHQDSLLQGYFLISKYRYPELKIEPLVAQIDQIKLDVWLRLNYQFSPIDNARILNEVFFEKHRFTGDSKDYYHPDNSFLNTVLERKKGNPISLSILYSIIAQKLYLPVFGVNLPNHFILAYKDDSELDANESFNSSSTLKHSMPGEVLFYLNVFNKGALFSRHNIDRFLKEKNLSSESSYYEPCSNKTILLRVLRNLINGYSMKNDHQRVEDLNELYQFLTSLE